MTLPLTPSQTVGPYFAIGLARRTENELVQPGSEGAIVLSGRVLDGEGEPVRDAMVEIWQPHAAGEFRADSGWGRCGTDADGRYSFVTVKPGGADGEAPHVKMLVFMRGLLKPVLTRVYFPDEADANAGDPVLRGVPDDSRSRLVAQQEGAELRFDVRMQGEDQTPFFTL